MTASIEVLLKPWLRNSLRAAEVICSRFAARRLSVAVGINRAPPATSDVLNALLALGYSDKEAIAAVKQLPEGIAVGDGIRQALKLLAKS